MPLLQGIKVSKNFGGVFALRDVDFSVENGEIVALIGPNGSGKTTLFNCISGIYRVQHGKIIFNGHDITNLAPYKICKLGVGRTFQIPKPFLNMATLKNVATALLFGKDTNISLKKANVEALHYLDLIGLRGKKDVLVKNLTLHERRKLEIARALATKPKIILLDEVLAGLNPTEIQQTIELIKKIKEEFQITVFWIEHVMRAVMQVAERVIVLNYGQKIAEGKPNEIAHDKKVIEAYLGEKPI